MNAGLAVAAVFAPLLLIGLSGARAAHIGTALLLLALVAAALRRLRSIDGAADVPQVQNQLLRLIPIFAPLPAPEPEGLARRSNPSRSRPGSRSFERGTAATASMPWQTVKCA